MEEHWIRSFTNLTLLQRIPKAEKDLSRPNRGRKRLYYQDPVERSVILALTQHWSDKTTRSLHPCTCDMAEFVLEDLTFAKTQVGSLTAHSEDRPKHCEVHDRQQAEKPFSYYEHWGSVDCRWSGAHVVSRTSKSFARSLVRRDEPSTRHKSESQWLSSLRLWFLDPKSPSSRPCGWNPALSGQKNHIDSNAAWMKMRILTWRLVMNLLFASFSFACLYVFIF